MARTIEEHIGGKVAALREQREWSQRELGEALERATGRKWERQSVWAAEHGKRAWAVSDLLGLADVFNLTVAELVSTDVPLLVGGVERTPRDIMMRTEGDAHLQGHWRTYHALISMANVLRASESEYDDMARDLRNQVRVSPELGDLIREHRDRNLETQRNKFLRLAEQDGEDVSTPAKLAAYMDSYGVNRIPVIRAANDVLKEDNNGEGN